VATEAAWLNGKREKNSWKEQNTLDRDRPSPSWKALCCLCVWKCAFVYASDMIYYSQPQGRHIQVETQKNSERVHRFVEAFEKLYGRKPRPEDAEGNFTIQVAQDMQMSVGGARYYIHLATQHKTRS